MKLVASRDSLRRRFEVESIACFMAREIMPGCEGALQLLDEDVTRIAGRFQEEIESRHGLQQRDIILDGWSGGWGTFWTLVLDRDDGLIKSWARRQTMIEVKQLDTREGKAALEAALEDALLSRQDHAYVLGRDFEALPNYGYSCYHGILTIAYRLVRKGEAHRPPPLSYLVEVFVSTLLGKKH